jgi:hypothetical protein
MTGHRVFVTAFTVLAAALYVLLLLDAAPPLSLPAAAMVPFVLLGLPVIFCVAGLGLVRLPFTALIQFLALHNAALLLVIKFGSGVRYRIDSPQLLAVTILLVEVFALLALARIVIRAVADIRSGTPARTAFRTAFRQFLDRRLQNPLLRLALTEVRLIAAAFRWRKPDLGPRDAGYTFIVHSGSDLTYVAVVVGLLTLLEIPLIHLLLSTWSPVAAWIISGLSVYFLLWVTGLANSARTFTSSISPEALHLQRGLYWSLSSPLANIVAAEVVPAGDAAQGANLPSAAGADGAAVVIQLEFAALVRKHALLSAPREVGGITFRVPEQIAPEVLSRIPVGKATR